MRTGIETAPQFEGYVSPFEERAAAIYNHYNFRQWQALDSEERALGIAHYRMNAFIAIHQNDAVAKDTERKALKNKQQQR